MREKAFDQLPVTSKSSSKKLIGLATLGNLLAKISSGRADLSDPVSSCCFHFQVDKKFVEITLSTPLDSLSKFFENNSAAVVTKNTNNGLEVLHIVTKVDLLSFLVKKTNVK
jgi:cystathionine beta-synthase